MFERQQNVEETKYGNSCFGNVKTTIACEVGNASCQYGYEQTRQVTDNDLYGEVSSFSSWSDTLHGSSVKNDGCQTITALEIHESDEECHPYYTP